MSRTVRIHEFGEPEVLRFDDLVVDDPGPGQVRLRVKAGEQVGKIVVTV